MGNYAVRQTDARGNAAISETDPNLGTLTSVIDARGETVSCAYDTLKRLTETSAPLGSLTRKTETVYGPDDRVREIKHNTTGSDCDVSYTFTYDEAGRQKEVKVGNRKLSEQFYNPDGTLEKTVFGNSTSARPQEVHFRYDGYKRLQGIRYDGAAEDQITYDIDARGLTVRVTDHTKDHTLITEYDAADRPEWSAQRMGGTHLYTVTLSYDSHGNISAVQERAGNDSTFYETLLTWNADNRPVKVEYDRINSSRISYSYDPLGRLTKRTLKLPGRSYETSYTYIPSTFGTGNTTGLVRTVTQAGKTLTYSYDACGNITQVKTGALYTKYSYDKLGRLTRVNDQTDLTADPTGTTWVYTYDLGGNIKTKKMYVYTTTVMTGLTPLVTHTLTYSATAWKDKVTKVNGVSITYDNIGNPLNDGAWAYSWEHGRQLRQMAKTDNTETILYEYNASGLRTKKTVTDTNSNSTTATEYILHGKNIVHMTEGSHTLHFLYDGQGKPGIVSYDGTQYGYLYNLQGDVIALVDAAGTKVVEYTYDAWGRPTSKTGTLAGTLGTVQPFRYRGYVYDEETGLYYLRSRYYNPVWCRFLNADAVFDGTNLFAYCGNNPILFSDPCGKVGILAFFAVFTLINVVIDHKLLLSSVADEFLKKRGWTATNILFQHGLWHEEQPFTDSTDDQELLSSVNIVKDLIENDPQTIDILQPYIVQATPGQQVPIINYVPEYESGDMYYSIQHATMNGIVFGFSDGGWEAIVTIQDEYDFTKLRWPFSLGGAANDMGFILQNIGSIKTFNISLTVHIIGR